MRVRSELRTLTRDMPGDTGKRVYLRRGMQAHWRIVNPVLEDREVGYELDTDRFRVGDGKTAWNNLPYYARADI